MSPSLGFVATREDDYYTLEVAKESVGKGWSDILTCLWAELNPSAHIVQVKEKWGVLTIYFIADSREVYEQTDVLISKAEYESAHTCEICGDSGYSDDDGTGWLLTLCFGHHEERRKKRENSQTS